jgi:uncharacterized protein YigA (DUF484 family)
MRIQRNREQLHQKLHAVFVRIVDGSSLKDVVATFENLVDVIQVVWVSLNAEVHEGNL